MCSSSNSSSKSNKPVVFTLEEIQQADQELCGFCIKCGAMRSCCEPDARGYKCDECGASEVYGAAEIALMGLVE